MAPTFTNKTIRPGFYFTIEDNPAPNVVGADYLPLAIGLGRKELDVTKLLTRGAVADGTDLITDEQKVVKIIDLIDENGINYVQDIDYILKRTSAANVDTYGVDWDVSVGIIGTSTDFTNIASLTLQLKVDGVTDTVTFAVGDNTLGEAVITINAEFAGCAEDSGGYLKLNGNSVEVLGGSALDEVGFKKGDSIESIEPAAGVDYTLYFRRLKISTDYGQKWFTRLDDVYANQGDAEKIPEVIFEQDDGAGITVAAETDSADLSVLTDTAETGFTDVLPGYYIKIISGAGAGQIRVILEVDATTHKIWFENFDEDADTTSTYVITDEGYYQISTMAKFARLTGATQFMISQAIDDDLVCFKTALDVTENKTSGQQGYCLTPAWPMDATESFVSYIKTYLARVNSVTGNQERIAIFGIKNNLTATEVITLIDAVAYERGFVITAPYMINDGQTYGSEYIAALVSGIVCNPDYNAGESMSGKVLPVDYIDNPWINNETLLFLKHGGIPIEQSGIDNKIVQFLSTDQTDINKAEGKITKQKDAIKKKLRNGYEKALTNVRATDEVPSRAMSISNTILDAMKGISEIKDYETPVIAYNITEPRQLDISFMFVGMFDVNFGNVKFGATLKF